LKIPKFLNTKIIFFKVHMKKGTYPIYSLVNLHTKKFENPQNDKKKIKDSGTSKYEKKKNSKFTRRHANTPSPPL